MSERPSASPFRSLDHVLVAVDDLDAATSDYRLLLGREPAWRGEHPGQGTANALFRLENGYLELLAPAGDGVHGAAVQAHLEARGEGLFGIALGCGDAEACAGALRERGLHPSDPVDGYGRDAATGAERRWRSVFLPAGETRGVLVFAIEHRTAPNAWPSSQPVGDEVASAGAFDHVVVLSQDADGSRAFYEDGLGLRMALDRRFEAFGSRLVFFRVGGVSIEIGASLSEPPDPSAPDRLWGLAYRVPDVAAARVRLAAGGADVSEVRSGRKPGTVVATVRAPTRGVATLLIGPDPAGAVGTS